MASTKPDPVPVAIQGELCYRAPDAATVLGISVRSVYFRMANGTIRTVQRRRRNYIPLDEVDRIKAEHALNPPAIPGPKNPRLVLRCRFCRRLFSISAKTYHWGVRMGIRQRYCNPLCALVMRNYRQCVRCRATYTKRKTAPYCGARCRRQAEKGIPLELDYSLVIAEQSGAIAMSPPSTAGSVPQASKPAPSTL